MTEPFPHHRVSVHGRQGPLTLTIAATLTAPWTVLFGPSGSGKSTLLRALAGLTPHLRTAFERRERGSERWHPLHTAPPQLRGLAYDPQGALLLSHLTVVDNVRFPESIRCTPAVRSRVPALLELLDLRALADKRPAQLSGGERQRVALARALAVPEAHLVLLDEPFAGFDRTLRDKLIPMLRAHLSARALPVLSVTHDPDETLLLEAEVLRLDSGQLIGQGPAHEILADEVARLRNLLDQHG